MPVETAKTIHIQYYALLRELRGLSEETLQTEAITPAELYELLHRQYGFTLEQSRLQVAVNDAFVAWNTLLKNDDRVVFIPPVAGG